MTKVQIILIQQALDDPDPLNDWERSFICNLADKDKKYFVSRKENNVLKHISKKYT